MTLPATVQKGQNVTGQRTVKIALRTACGGDFVFARNLYFETMRGMIERLFGWDQKREEDMKDVATAKGLDPNKYHPHMLRRCFATHCHDNGMPIEVVSALLGHTHLSTTVIYTQISTARMVQSYNAAHPHAK